MGKHRAFLKRRQTRRLVEHQKGARTAYVLYETAWSDAWPHLDDWFKKGFLDGVAGTDPALD